MTTVSARWRLVACWLALAAAGVVAGLLLKSHSTPDLRVTRMVVDWRTPQASDAFRALSTVGSPLWVASACALLAAVLLVRKAHAQALLVLLAYPGTALLVNVVKALVDRPRPRVVALSNVSTSGFPSGHAAGSLALIGAALMLAMPHAQRARWPLAAAGVLLVLAIGASRVYLGVHYLSDVLAGWALSGIWLVALRRSLG
jgi:undecaprenyl-diphosphatase